MLRASGRPPLLPSLRASRRTDPYHGISSSPFPPEVVEVLTAPLSEEDVEIKLDGLLFLPEIKYRRTLNRAFGPGGWALMPMGEILHFQVTSTRSSSSTGGRCTMVLLKQAAQWVAPLLCRQATCCDCLGVLPCQPHVPCRLQNEVEGAQLITREYALYCSGRFVAQAMGEHTFYSKSNLAYGKACESAKSNALMRCCKDLGIASELWDPRVSAWVTPTRPCATCCVCHCAAFTVR